MHGHKKKKSEWDKKRFKSGSRNMWNLDDETEIFRNPKKKRKFHYGEENHAEADESSDEEEDYEEDYEEDR